MGSRGTARAAVCAALLAACGQGAAPQTTGTFHVIATSHADPSRSATATVTVQPGAVQVVVRPAAVTLAVNGTRRLAAQVSGNPDTAVLWSVSEGNSGGTVDPTGLYTAPATVGTFHVVATSHADPAISATATVTVQLTPPPVLGQWDPVETWPVVPNQGGLYIDIVPLRDALGRYGLTVGDVERTIESAIGGAPIGVTVEGRNRFSINVRYPQDARSDLERLRGVLVAIAPAEGAATPATAEAVAVAQSEPDRAQHPSDGTPPLRPVGGRSAVPWQSVDPAALQGLTGEGVTTAAKRGFVSLGQVADIRIVGGPPMVRDEGGLLVGYVFVDVDPSQRDLGGYVSEAKQVVQAALADGRLKMPQGHFFKWTGQYEELEKMAARMRIIVPAALLLIVALLFLHFRNLIEVLIVLLSVPFALAGSVWFLWLLDYRLSTAVWVGVIALVGLAAQTGIVMIVYIDNAYQRRKSAGRIRDLSDIIRAHMEGTVQRVRPKLMTVAAMLGGLVPLLWATGSGAEVMKRMAAPMVGGLITSALLTLEIIPVVYTYWRQEQLLWERAADLDGAVLRALRVWAPVQGAGRTRLPSTGRSVLYVDLAAPIRLGAFTASAGLIAIGAAGYLPARPAPRRVVLPAVVAA